MDRIRTTFNFFPILYLYFNCEIFPSKYNIITDYNITVVILFYFSIESCVDLECSESDSFIDEILGDIHESSTYSTSHTDDDISSYYSTPAPSSTDGYQMDMLLTGIIPLSNNVTPDITTSLLNIQEQQTPESITLSDDSCDRKGVKRKLFSLEEEENNNIPPAKRQHVFICDDETVFSIFHDLLNHIQGDKKQ
jgi:hypothetical protein